MSGLHRREYLHQLRNDRTRQRAAGDHRRQLPPKGPVTEVGQQQIRHEVGQRNRDQRSKPHQRSERRFEVHVVDMDVAGPGNSFVDQIRETAGDDHHDAHDEDPDQQLDLHRRLPDGEDDEGDERHAGDAVRLEAVGARTHRVTRVVAGAIGNHTRVSCIVFLDVEDDLHQVGSDIGDLGEDSAGNTQRRRAERLTDRKADKARARIIAGNEEQNEQHDHQLDADEQHADAHSRLERDGVARERFAAQTRERSARVGEGVDADPEPRDAITATDSHQTE